MSLKTPEPAKVVRGDRWIVGNEEDNTNIWALTQFTPSFLIDFAQISNFGPLYHCFEFRDQHMTWVVPAKYAGKLARKLTDRAIKKPNSYRSLTKLLITKCDSLYSFSRKVLRLADKGKLELMVDKELEQLCHHHERLVRQVYAYGMISTLTDFLNADFTKQIELLATERATRRNLAKSPAEYITALSEITQESVQRQEQTELLKLAVVVKKKKLVKKGKIVTDINLRRAIKKHVKNFDWVYYGYNGPAFSAQRVLSELSNIVIKSVINLAEELSAYKRLHRSIGSMRRQAEHELGLSTYEKELFSAYRATIFMKLYRKDAVTHSLYAMEPVLKEVARRVRLPLETVRRVVPGEIGSLLRRETGLLQNLRQRGKYCVYSVVNKKPIVLTGNDALRYWKKVYIPEKVSGITEIKGQVACVGP